MHCLCSSSHTFGSAWYFQNCKCTKKCKKCKNVIVSFVQCPKRANLWAKGVSHGVPLYRHFMFNELFTSLYLPSSCLNLQIGDIIDTEKQCAYGICTLTGIEERQNSTCDSKYGKYLIFMKLLIVLENNWLTLKNISVCEDGREWQEIPCERTCSNPDINCATTDVQPACACPEDLVWNGQECIPPEECVCVHNGVEYNEGESWTEDDCVHCKCVNSKPVCSEKCDLTAQNCTSKVCHHYVNMPYHSCLSLKASNKQPERGEARLSDIYQNLFY